MFVSCEHLSLYYKFILYVCEHVFDTNCVRHFFFCYNVICVNCDMCGFVRYNINFIKKL